MTASSVDVKQASKPARQRQVIHGGASIERPAGPTTLPAELSTAERMVAEALAPGADGTVRRIAKRRFYPWPENEYVTTGASYRKDDPLTPLFHLRTYADQVLGSSLARLSSSDVTEIGKLGVRLVKAARAELDSRGVGS